MIQVLRIIDDVYNLIQKILPDAIKQFPHHLFAWKPTIIIILDNNYNCIIEHNTDHTGHPTNQ